MYFRLVLGVFLCVSIGRGITVPTSEMSAAGARRDTPQRCAEHSATAVSCERAAADALLPHPADCQLFYYCVPGEPAPLCRQCPAGLHFSPSEHVCAAPEVAGCAAADAAI